MKGCVKIVKDKPFTKMIRLDGLNSDTIYDIAIQGTNRAGDGTLSRAVTAQTKDYEKRPLVVGFLNQNAGKSYMKSILNCCGLRKTPSSVYVVLEREAREFQ